MVGRFIWSIYEIDHHVINVTILKIKNKYANISAGQKELYKRVAAPNSVLLKKKYAYKVYASKQFAIYQGNISTAQQKSHPCLFTHHILIKYVF